MDARITATIFFSVLNAALCFNIDPVAWRTLTNDAAGFGYQVVQRASDLLVSAPLAQYSPGGRGQIFRCSTTSCRQLSVPLPDFAVNASLGLTMVSDPGTQNTMACGPTIPKDCQSITMYNGLCFQIDRLNRVGKPVPSSLEECRSVADIAFLLDGSGSVIREDFSKMKNFVRDMVRSFLGKDTKFSISQFSTETEIHYFFNTFDASNWQNQIDAIKQNGGWTFTAAAIEHVVQSVFSPSRGSRPDVKKVLIVITDGKSNDGQKLQSATNLADTKNIVRFAIGVGGAFSAAEAKKELDSIASSPASNHVFQVDSFDALDIIRQNLQDKIFAIEGSSTGGETLTMEMSQLGFSAAYLPERIQMAIVGANQWRGGFLEYTSSGQMRSSYEPSFMESDSYLGYSMAVVTTPQGPLTVVGAPRYQHRGVVLAVQGNRHQKIDPFPWQFQSGEYFGAEVCAMDLNGDAFTDLVLISAPMYVDDGREGRVYICTLSGLVVDCPLNALSVLKGDVSDSGRFGSSLAVLPDLNTDGFSDLAVGAPLENDNQGSVYIFLSNGQGSVNLRYSQRIVGSEVMPGLKFFGMSISRSSFDLSGDRLPDLAVGSQGRVVLLRSKPIMMLETTVSYSPNLIPSQNSQECSTPLQNTAKVCFFMTRMSTVDAARARINFTLTLDATRMALTSRAFFSEKQRVETRSTDVDLQQRRCVRVPFFVEACPEDGLNPLDNELELTFEGLPSNTNLRPSLAEHAQTTGKYPLSFEINCGEDSKCVDNLKVDFNFSRSSEVKVGIDDVLDVTVSLENSMENSYNSHVILTYPAGLSYRKLTALQGRIECDSLDSVAGSSRGKTDCTINKPVFWSKTTALFIVSYGVKTQSQFDKRIFVTANATSGNEEHSTSSELYKLQWIDVKYSIYVSFESSSSYNNFSFGQNNLQKPLEQKLVVINDIRPFNLSVVIRVPVKLGDKDIWADSRGLQIPDCQKDKDEEPLVTNFVAQIQKNKLVDCSVATCRVFKCNIFIGKLESKIFNISAKISSGWIKQIGLQTARFLLTSTASLEYDRDQYIFFNNNPPVREIKAEVEVYPDLDFTKEIVGGTLGGLALLALITAGLYKAGFFKSKYQDMMNKNAEGAEDPGADGGEPTP